MPFQRRLYPADWKEISLRIRARANGKCEWCGAENGKPHPLTGSTVVLTVAHLGAPKPDGSPGDRHDKMDCRDENLVALCQKDHLDLDREDHIKRARDTRRRKKLERSGQISLHLPIREPTEPLELFREAHEIHCAGP